LGVRPGIDVPAAKPADMVQPGEGGLSVSPDDPTNLPLYRRPVAFGGSGKDPVWMIDELDLAMMLIYRPDPLNLAHGFMEPARPMTLGDFQDAIERTHDLWKKVDAWPIQGSSTDGN
jgi:hypothetical protein